MTVPDLLAKEADFFSIGTNDLTGYTMAVDRGNSKVSYLYSSYNPAVIRSIRRIIKAAKETGRILTVEEHSMYGGLGAIVAETVAQNCPVPMKILGIPDENAIHGKPLEIFHYYKLDAEGIYETAKTFVK